MVFLRRRKMLAPINSTKHYIHHTLFSVPVGTVTNLIEIVAVALNLVTNATDVRAGAVVKAIFVELWINADSGSSNATFNITVEKTSGGQPNMTFAQSIGLMAYPNKKNILYTTQGLVGGTTNNAVPILKQWFAIPKGKQRFGVGDELRVNLSAITLGLTVCGISIYKEYY